MSEPFDLHRPPTTAMWNLRRSWFEGQFASDEGCGGYLIGEHATALVQQAELAFCVGAWIIVVIVAAAIVEAQLREVEAPDSKANSFSLINSLGLSEDYHWLRKRRNELIHWSQDSALYLDDGSSDLLEADAKRAVGLALRCLYSDPWV